jgi:hypothetical protein
MDVYDLAEWCSLAELGAISMDNGCAPIEFPDFTRGHWNDQQGYKHAYAPAEEEAIAEAKADAYTAAQQEATAACNLWALYDAVKQAPEAEKAKAQETYKAAVAQAEKMIAEAMKK